MDTPGPWKLIKIGFWLGVGFMIPTLLVTVVSSAAMFAIPFLALMGDHDLSLDAEDVSSLSSSFDGTADMRILKHRDVLQNDRLLIFGEVENTGEQATSSVHIEAELLNEQGEMVYECSEYLQRVAPGATESFQITCSCGGQPAPEYVSYTVKVTSASRM